MTTQEERIKNSIWSQTLPPFVSLGQGHQAPNVRIKCLAVLLCLHSRELSNGEKHSSRVLTRSGKSSVNNPALAEVFISICGKFDII